MGGAILHNNTKIKIMSVDVKDPKRFVGEHVKISFIKKIPISEEIKDDKIKGIITITENGDFKIKNFVLPLEKIRFIQRMN